MKMPHGRFAKLVCFLPLLILSCMASLNYAQTPNPFQSLKDAVNRAVKQVPNQPPAQPAATPAAQAGAPPPSSDTAATPVAVASSSVEAQPWAPPSESAAVPESKGPLDPAKLPDIVGVHVGIPKEDVAALIHKTFPEAAVQPIGRIEQGFGVWIAMSAKMPASEKIYFENVLPPAKGQVYYINRYSTFAELMSQKNYLEAAHKKYGPETAVRVGNGFRALWWLSDEQGHPVKPAEAKGEFQSPYGCDVNVNTGGSGFSTVVSQYVSNQLPPATFCDSLVILYVQIPETELIGAATSVLLDRAMLRREAINDGKAQQAAQQQKNKDLQQKANQAKPNI
jgi:hypothetical protein